MRWALASVVVVLAACAQPRLGVPETLAFDRVPALQTRTVPLALSNARSGVSDVTLEVSGDFSVSPSTLRLQPRESAVVQVSFTPTALGPRQGVLTVHDGAQVYAVALSGQGTGPALEVDPQVSLGLVPLTPSARAKTARVLVTNGGTPESSLELGASRVEGSAELCVGEFVSGACVAWTPTGPVAQGETVEVPLSVLPTAEGQRQWTVVFPSNDPLLPEARVEVLARVAAFEPCVFTLPQKLELAPRSAFLTLRHEGTGTCLFARATVTSTPAESVEVLVPTSLPRPLVAGEEFTLTLRQRPPAVGPVSGQLLLEAAGSPVKVVPFETAPLDLAQCLVAAPPSFNFGFVPEGCNSPTRWVTLYNSCSRPLVLDGVEVVGSSFWLVSAPAAGSTLTPGSSSPLVVGIRARPEQVGSSTGALRLKLQGGREVLVALQVSGGARGDMVDRFRIETLPVSDLLVLVDASPSFVPRRAATRANLERLFRAPFIPCTDMRVGVAAADGAPDAGVELLRSDAGARWFFSQEPGFADHVLSAFDSLPVGSEVEACIGPAVDVLSDAGLRPETRVFGGLCITDALEQSPSPFARLQEFSGLVDGGVSTWSVVSGKGSLCSLESSDDGTHAALVQTTAGYHLDVCDADWASLMFPGSLGTCGVRTRFYLSALASVIREVRLDGRPVPSTDWTYDAATNSIVFDVQHAPGWGQLLEVVYPGPCVP